MSGVVVGVFQILKKETNKETKKKMKIKNRKIEEFE